MMPPIGCLPRKIGVMTSLNSSFGSLPEMKASITCVSASRIASNSAKETEVWKGVFSRICWRRRSMGRVASRLTTCTSTRTHKYPHVLVRVRVSPQAPKIRLVYGYKRVSWSGSQVRFKCGSQVRVTSAGHKYGSRVGRGNCPKMLFFQTIFTVFDQKSSTFGILKVIESLNGFSKKNLNFFYKIILEDSYFRNTRLLQACKMHLCNLYIRTCHTRLSQVSN